MAISQIFKMAEIRHLEFYGPVMVSLKSPCRTSRRLVGCVAQLVERRSLTGELSLSCARPAADG